ncbi:uncharacterized protein LOC143018470 [Oratosquilla oratoria]|uniref:uncharacterized protein LOC143018470 n=1 Tax=Oratosquilla oratoria TaxID=337810 RepID=UPI003F76B79A
MAPLPIEDTLVLPPAPHPQPQQLQEQTVAEEIQQEEGTVAPVVRYQHNPPQVSLPPELLAKLERQDSCESVGSLEEEDEEEDEDARPDATQESQESSDGSDLVLRSERSSSVVSDGSEEGGRDSGIEAEREPDMVVPDDELMGKIVAQVEFYFSDSNVAKDKFLLKHIRRNKEGYVSLKLVSSFKKVKQLTKDWRVVMYALNKISTKIQINDVGTKIRRVDPLPEIDDIPVTRAVLALSLPMDKPSIESVSQLFTSCGEIAFIRVLRAGGTIPQDIKSLAAKYPTLNECNSAWIEFETPEAAKAATELSAEDGMQVVAILPESQKKQEKQAQQQQQQQKQQNNSRKNSTSGTQQQRGQNSRKSSTSSNKSRKDSVTGSSEDENNRKQQRRKAQSLPQTQSPNLKELSAVVEARRNRPKSKSCTEFQTSGSPPTSWVQRHLLAAAAASAASAAAPVVGSRPPAARPSRVSIGSLTLPDGVLRHPKGPDGTKGFNPDCRRRTFSATAAAPTTPPVSTTTTAAIPIATPNAALAVAVVTSSSVPSSISS